MGEWTRILGIDPGSRVTGFGCIESNGAASRYVASGCIRTDGAALPPRLRAIFDGVRALVVQHQPQEIAIEQVFVHRNADSALKLGQARSAAICATFGPGVAVHEYAARAVKQAVVGRGGADKAQVQHMVRALLRLTTPLLADEADALAVALCHAHSRPLAARLAAVSGLRVVRG
ncbi:MAG: crossover junction endodeoxyribonuclease RuvC [Gammaproteobacteria bacterium]|nr:MAG: crossover junction endodeoxyribonuclease RuvC [Gammaproteobacteria bacterium]